MEIQNAVNGGAIAVLKCGKMIDAWDTITVPKNVQLIINPNLPPVMGTGAQGTYYDRISQDKEILKVILLLTGAIRCARKECALFVTQFSRYDSLWLQNIDQEYEKFRKEEPTLGEFEAKIKHFRKLALEAEKLNTSQQISALLLKTGTLSKSLKELAEKWQTTFAKKLHLQARQKLDSVSEMVRHTTKRLNRSVEDGDIDALGYVMQTLQDVRAKQSEIELEFEPISYMYQILDNNCPSIIDKDEQDQRSMLRNNWEKLLEDSESRQDELSVKQVRAMMCVLSGLGVQFL